jgi:hypothetical protein
MEADREDDDDPLRDTGASRDHDPGDQAPSRGAPWPNRVATEKIRAYAKNPGLKLSYKKHAQEQLRERGIIIGDVLHVLKMGFVLTPPRPSSDPELFKYRVESKSPNSNGRTIGVVVIPNVCRPSMKIVTVMWVDEDLVGRR